jgi:hypothetical protein
MGIVPYYQNPRGIPLSIKASQRHVTVRVHTTIPTIFNALCFVGESIIVPVNFELKYQLSLQIKF